MNEVFIMRGGNPLRGEVTIGGAKNAALGIIAGALLTEDKVTIENLPDVRDVNVMLEALKEVGAKVDRVDAHTAVIEAKNISMHSIVEGFVRLIILSVHCLENTMRLQYLFQADVPSGSVQSTST